jgi:alpha-ketoglutarate-dependent taurine dioxygenase
MDRMGLLLIKEVRVVNHSGSGVRSDPVGRTTRMRVVEEVDQLHEQPITPAELREHCVVVRSAAAGGADTVSTVRRLLPWMSIWDDHPSYRTGVWRCVVDAPTAGPQYTAYRKQTLDFHTDMSRYVRPPEFTAIRCTVPDADGGGDNLVLHVDDVVDRLRTRGRQDIVDMLAANRLLNVESRHITVPQARTGGSTSIRDSVRAAIAVADQPLTPSRVFDRHGATKGSHLALSAAEEGLLDEFVDACASSQDLAVRIRLEAGDVVVFSNWRMMHARLACVGSGRVTEISMGNVRDDGHGTS